AITTTTRTPSVYMYVDQGYFDLLRRQQARDTLTAAARDGRNIGEAAESGHRFESAGHTLDASLQRRAMPAASPGPATGLLRAWSEGDQGALEALVPLVEAELRRLARIYMARERRDHTLQATALVNEAFLRLAG